MSRILLFSVFLSCWFSGFAQSPAKESIIFSGVVKDSIGGEPLEKATITLKGPKRFTVLTDAKGAFTINGILPGNYSLAIVFVGYTP
jgi:protocatechuate 3,4-dioxygenase beta subunit